jgi:NADH-ubiquinone oxidoreductase chain 6
VESLDIISLLAILSGISVIIIKNPITSVLFLIGLFVCIAVYLNMIGLYFIGLSYLLVYVGAVSILFLFILMLINVRVSELVSNTNVVVILAVITSISFNYPINQVLPFSVVQSSSTSLLGGDIIFGYFSSFISSLFSLFVSYGKEVSNSEIYYVSSNIWDGNLSEASHITSIGNIMYTSYSMWLVITSIILLLAMVGAIVITIKPKH